MLPVFFLLATVFFEDNFDDDDWDRRWIQSRNRPIKGDGKIGSFRLTAGAYYGSQSAQRGLQTVDEAAYYQFSSKLAQPMNTSGRDFVLQYTVRFENGYECSGGYVKLLSSSMQPQKFSGNSQYLLMFGPEVCKPNTHKVMFIVERNDTYHDNKEFVDSFYDELTHAYTLIIFANRTYQIRLDGQFALGGDIDDHFELFGSKLIPDPDDQMPEDWDNRKVIPDPDDVKPDYWDERPLIEDPDATQPPEWREDINGKWKPPLIQNPNYRGIWKPRVIQNPNYQGEWVPRMIENPEYVRDPGFGVFEDIGYIGLEVFQVTPGSIFDNFLITDDVEYAEKKLHENFLQYKSDEFAMYKRVLQDRAAEEELRKLREKESAEITDDDFYTQSSSGYSDSSSSSISEESSSIFNFRSDEITDAPDPKDFEFPYNIDNNPYFIKKKSLQIKKSSKKRLRKWQDEREEKKIEEEVSESREL